LNRLGSGDLHVDATGAHLHVNVGMWLTVACMWRCAKAIPWRSCGAPIATKTRAVNFATGLTQVPFPRSSHAGRLNNATGRRQVSWSATIIVRILREVCDLDPSVSTSSCLKHPLPILEGVEIYVLVIPEARIVHITKDKTESWPQANSYISHVTNTIAITNLHSRSGD
jgi:hypothetical protein